MKKIAILKGGPGLEREVALKSAAYIEENLDRPFDSYTLPEELDLFLTKMKEYEKVIPIFHGEYGEDGKIQAFLDILGIPYAYSDYSTHAFLLDKYNTNIIAKSLNISIPKDALVKHKDIQNKLGSSLFELSGGVLEKYPIIFKPNKGGSSFFTYKINSDEELNNKLKKALEELDDDILLQEFISGDEYSVPIVNGKTLAIMKLEKKEPDLVFDYDSKYENEDLMRETFPEIPLKLSQKLEKDTQILWDHFNMRDAVRIDYLVDGDICYFIDANTIPGMAPASIIPQAWRLSGKNDKEFAQMLCS